MFIAREPTIQIRPQRGRTECHRWDPAGVRGNTAPLRAIDIRFLRNRLDSQIVFPIRLFAITLSFLLVSACSTGSETPSNSSVTETPKKVPESLAADMRAIEPFFKPMGKPEAYDWLGSHYEAGQTFEEYINQNPTLPTADRGKLYVLPLGSFSPTQKKIIDVATGYLEAFYGLPVEQLQPRPFKPAY